MSNIPEARRRLHEVLTYCKLDQNTRNRLFAIARLLPREAPVTRAPVTSNKLTPKIKDQIVALHLANPDMSQQDIAVAVNVTAGRVSETLSGKRGRRWRA